MFVLWFKSKVTFLISFQRLLSCWWADYLILMCHEGCAIYSFSMDIMICRCAIVTLQDVWCPVVFSTSANSGCFSLRKSLPLHHHRGSNTLNAPWLHKERGERRHLEELRVRKHRCILGGRFLPDSNTPLNECLYELVSWSDRGINGQPVIQQNKITYGTVMKTQLEAGLIYL